MCVFTVYIYIYIYIYICVSVCVSVCVCITCYIVIEAVIAVTRRTSVLKKGSYLFGQDMKTDDCTDSSEEKGKVPYLKPV